MLFRLITTTAIFILSTTVWAQDNPPTSALLKGEDKPIPLFPSAPKISEKTEPTLNQPATPVIQEVAVQDGVSPEDIASEAASQQEVASQEASSQKTALQGIPPQKVALPAQPSGERHQAILKTENVQPLEVETTDSAAQLAKAQDLQVLDFVLTNRVIKREPQGALDTFAEGAKQGVAFARLHANVNTEVTFVWLRDGQEYRRYKAPVQATKQWRTFSSINLRPGDWKVQLVGKNNEVLAEKSFLVKK